MKKLLIILGSLFVAGVAIAGVLYVSFPVAMSKTHTSLAISFSFTGMPVVRTTASFVPSGEITGLM